MHVHQTRIRNLSDIIQRQFQGNNAAFSRFIDVQAAQINRLFYASEKGGRNLGDNFARQIEEKLRLENGWLDTPHWLTRRSETTPHGEPTPALVQNLRQAVPYFNSLSQKCIVIHIDSEILDNYDILSDLINDIALLDSIGARIILVHGSRVQIDRQLVIMGGDPPCYHDGVRITDEHSLIAVKSAVGETRIQIESLLSLGLANSPLDGARLAVVSGNAVVGQPIGVKKGVDFRHSGVIRNIQTDYIHRWLQSHSIVLLSSLAYSPTGDMYNVPSLDVATQCATAMKADKLVLLSTHPIPTDGEGKRISLMEASNPPAHYEADDSMKSYVEASLYASTHGVHRCHILDATREGAIVSELFTRNGTGTMIGDEKQYTIRTASIEDVAAIMNITLPLEEDGILAPRSRQLIENRIEDFLVAEREGQIIGCAALHRYPQDSIGEIACVAIANTHQGQGLADQMVSRLEQQAKAEKLNQLFVLTTDTSQWFQQRHYRLGRLEDLPLNRRKLYDNRRQSRIYFKVI